MVELTRSRGERGEGEEKRTNAPLPEPSDSPLEMASPDGESAREGAVVRAVRRKQDVLPYGLSCDR